jgi:hypothetical protein
MFPPSDEREGKQHNLGCSVAVISSFYWVQLRGSLPSFSAEGGKSSGFGNIFGNTRRWIKSINPIILEGGCSEQNA